MSNFYRIRDVDPPGDKLVPITAALAACEIGANDGRTLLRLTKRPDMRVWRTMGQTTAERISVATLSDVLSLLDRTLPRFTPSQRLAVVNPARDPLIIGDYK